MKYNLEIQSQELNIQESKILELVKQSLKMKKIPTTKIKNLNIYYVVDTKVIYYTGLYNNEEIKGEIFAD